VKVLLLAARFPELGRKGDQIRARQLIDLLTPQHDLTVVTAGRPSTPAAAAELASLVELVPIPVAAWQRAAGAAAAAVRLRPAEIGWFTPPAAWRAAVARAATADVALVCTIRCLPGALPAPTVLDHVDALSANLRQRARLERHLALRAAARVEAALLARHERRAARWVAAQAVVSPVDATALPQAPRPRVIPHALPPGDGDAPSGGPAERDIDVIMTGNMRYPPNREAAEWLIREIVPELRRRRDAPRVVVAGRDAAMVLRSDGVEVLGDVPDLAPLLRRARVAAVPLRSGTGAPNKLFEAAAAGAAVVATPWVADAVGIDVEIAADAPAFARAIDRLLADETLRRARVETGRAGLAGRSPEAVRASLEALLAEAARAGSA
jgi:glycosyltransferase involved in cell wall biosynthesis